MTNPNIAFFITLILFIFSSHTSFTQSNSCDEGWEDERFRDGGTVSSADGFDNDEATYAGYNASLAPFYHGVASGDPKQNSVIIWTRVTPDDRAKEYTSSDIDVDWYVSTSPDVSTNAFANGVVQSGTFTTNQERDFTVKLTVEGLQEGTWYYYIFSAQNKWSIVGRTKTAPANPDHLRFGVVSCSNLAEGYFNAYDALNKRNDVDAVFHLGDYIYEYEDNHYGTFRGYSPPYEMVALEDYRSRYSIYRLEPEQRELHQNYPWVTTWDDHESTNDSWVGGAENHNADNNYKATYCADAVEGDWTIRKGNSKQAYNEWMPIKMEGDESQPDQLSLYRNFNYGDLADIYFLDTRLEGRDEPIDQTVVQNDPSRTLLGQAQYDWLTNNMQNSTAKWQVLAQQVMFANFDDASSSIPNDQFPGNAAAPNLVAINLDQWDGFAQERQKLMNFWNDNNVDNVVVLTGDIHTSWANEIPNGRDLYVPSTTLTPCSGTQAVEFVVTSVTSPGLDGTEAGVIPAAMANNPHMKYIELTDHGFMIFDITNDKVQSDWHYVNTLRDRNYSMLTGTDKEVSFFANADESCLNQTTERLPTATDFPDLMPLDPPTAVAGLNTRPTITLAAQQNCPSSKCPDPAFTNDALPIALTNWYGRNEGKTNVLYWETAIETNNSHYILERSTDGIHFEQLTQIQAAGEKTTATTYTFEDKSPVKGLNYYRLIQVDNDGIYNIFNTITIKTVVQFNQYNVAPNPAYHNTEVSFYSDLNEPIRIEIFDYNGQSIRKLETQAVEGNNTFKVDLTGLAPGPYMIGVHQLYSNRSGNGVVVKVQ